MNLRDVLARATDAVIWRWYSVGLLRFNSHDDGGDDLLLRSEIVGKAFADPALAAAERVLAAALDWRMNADRGTADELLLVVMGAVDDYLRAYRSAVEDQP